MSINNDSFLTGPKTYLPNEYRTLRDLFIHIFMNDDDDQRVCASSDQEKLKVEKLIQDAHRVATALIPYDIVVICMQPSLELIITLCGVILHGIPYVPLEPSLPFERMEYIINDSQASLIITQDNLENIRNKNWTNTKVLTYSQLMENMINIGDHFMKIINSEDTFCLMYTSGSTGEPKGVKIPQRALINRLYWQWSKFPFDKEKDICCLKTSISFVDSIVEIFAPLFRRIPIIIVSKLLLIDIDRLISVLSIQKISRIILVPSLLTVLLNHLQMSKINLIDLDMIVCSGEILSLKLIELYFANKHRFSSKCSLLNFYGSTEVMADATYEIFDSIHHLYDLRSLEGHTSIGVPIDNMYVEIVEPDERGVGELIISGEGIANGYYHRTITNEKILTNKFIRYTNDKFSFRTGDLGRIWNNRIIFMIKIAGNRVDLSEIELILRRHCNCEQPVAIFHDETSEIVLFLQKIEKFLNLDRYFLTNYLPSYAIPKRFIIVTEFPLLVSGKIDRRKLINLLNVVQNKDEEVEENETEQTRAFFCALNEIGIQRTHIDRSFFAAGGSSLNGLLFVAKLHQIGYNNITVERLMSVKSLREILSNQSEIEQSHGLLFDHHDDNQYNIVSLDQVDKYEAMQLISEAFTAKNEFDVLLHHHIPELELEYKRDWFVFLDYYWSHLVQDGLSFCLLRKNGQLIGIALSDDLLNDLDFDVTTVPRNAPIFNMIHAVENKLLEQLRSSNIHLQSIMHNIVTAVNVDVEQEQQVSVMYRIERHVLELASAKGFQAVLTTNTSSTIQQIAEHILKYDYNLVMQANEYRNSLDMPVFPNVLDKYKMIASIKLLT